MGFAMHAAVLANMPRNARQKPRSISLRSLTVQGPGSWQGCGSCLPSVSICSTDASIPALRTQNHHLGSDYSALRPHSPVLHDRNWRRQTIQRLDDAVFRRRRCMALGQPYGVMLRGKQRSAGHLHPCCAPLPVRHCAIR